MLKKIARYLGVALGLGLFVTLFTDTWAILAKVGKESERGAEIGLFGDLDLYELNFGKDFAKIWFTLFQIIVIVALVLAVVLAVVYILDDLKVLKLQKFEKILATLLLVVVILGVVVAAINTFVNAKSVEVLKASSKVMWMAGTWLFAGFGIVGSVLALVGAKKKK